MTKAIELSKGSYFKVKKNPYIYELFLSMYVKKYLDIELVNTWFLIEQEKFDLQKYILLLNNMKANKIKFTILSINIHFQKSFNFN